jgi:hypothetical protein
MDVIRQRGGIFKSYLHACDDAIEAACIGVGAVQGLSNSVPRWMQHRPWSTVQCCPSSGAQTLQIQPRFDQDNLLNDVSPAPNQPPPAMLTIP